METKINDASLHELNDQGAEKLLKGKKAGTYIFRKDANGKVFLTGVNKENEVQHSEIKKESGEWVGLNGGNHRAADLFSLIPKCLHCKPQECSQLIEETTSV